jgi:YebC/PmpR family DNA-binding regulatory protein
MSGHNKWSTIKHKKAAQDAKRGKAFTRVIKEITVSARIGGGDPDGNPRLRSAVAAAKAVNMPKDNIEKAILKGTGALPGVTYEEVVYEGYGPSGVAFYVEALTDNKNRTLPEIRHLFSKHGGNLGETNSVAWMFEKKGYVLVGSDQAVDEDRLLEIVLEAGGDDLTEDAEGWSITTAPEAHAHVVETLEAAGITPKRSAIEMVAKNSVQCDADQARKVLNMVDSLEDHDDVQNVSANFEIDDVVLAGLQ